MAPIGQALVSLTAGQDIPVLRQRAVLERPADVQSEKLNRIDVDGPSYSTRKGTAFHFWLKFRKQGVQRLALPALQKYLRTITSGSPFHGCANRAEHAQAFTGELVCQALETVQELPAILPFGGACANECEPGERWPGGGFPGGQFTAGDSFVATVQQFAPERMLRKRRLDDDPALLFFPPRTAGDLYETLREAFAAADFRGGRS